MELEGTKSLPVVPSERHTVPESSAPQSALEQKLKDCLRVNFEVFQSNVVSECQDILRKAEMELQDSMKRLESRSDDLLRRLRQSEDPAVQENQHVSSPSLSPRVRQGCAQESISAERSTSVPVLRRSPSVSSKGRDAFSDRVPFEVWPAWTKPTENRFAKRKSSSCNNDKAQRTMMMGQESLSKARCVVNPASNWYLLWQLLFTMVLCYELIIFPMSPFEISESHVIQDLSWFTMVFWTCDLVLTCFVGYYNNTGVLVVSHYRILRHYGKTWLLPDFLVILVDWIDIIGGGQTGAAKNIKVLRALRMFRLLRLLRLRKLREAMRMVDDLINSVYCSTIQTLFWNMAGIVVISHFLGCLWYAIGTTMLEQGDSWVQHYEFEHANWMLNYTTALHWAMCQFTPGGSRIHPRSVEETLYAILMLVIGMMLFSSIVSNITHATNSLKDITARYDRQLSALRRFFRQEKISLDLTYRVCSYADNVVKPMMSRLQLHEVELLKILPKPIVNEVVGEMYDQFLEVHAFFRKVSEQHKGIFQKVCNDLQTLALPTDVALWSSGETAHAMHFLTQGKLKYEIGVTDETHTVDLVQQGPKEPAIPVSEAVLWTPWIYQGKLASVAWCDLLSLSAHGFQEIMTSLPQVMWLPKAYSRAFVEELNRLDASGEAVSDLFTSQEAVDSLRTSSSRTINKFWA